MAQYLRLSRSLFRKAASVGTPFRTFCRENQQIGVLGAPLCKGQPKKGVELGPKYIREGGALIELEKLGHRVYDYGDVIFDDYDDHEMTVRGGNIVKNPRSVGSACKKISEKVAEIVRQGQTVLTLGGDHSVATGTVHGHASVESDLCVIWVDAHCDLNPVNESPSGNLHGIVLSMLLHELEETVPPVEGFNWVKRCLNARNLAYIALRDLDTGEKRIIRELGITHYSMQDVERLGVDRVISEATAAVNPNLDKPMHLSFDIDSLDPTVAPSTGTPVPGGLTLREGMYIADTLASQGRLTGIDVVEVNPRLGSEADAQKTVSAACQIISACFGQRTFSVREVAV